MSEPLCKVVSIPDGWPWAVETDSLITIDIPDSEGLAEASSPDLSDAEATEYVDRWIQRQFWGAHDGGSDE